MKIRTKLFISFICIFIYALSGVAFVTYFAFDINLAQTSVVQTMNSSEHEASVQKIIKDTLKILLYSIPLFFTTSLVFAAAVAKYVLRPVDDLIRISKKVSSGDFSVRAEVKGGDELSKFASLFNKMLNSVEEYEKKALGLEKNKYENLIENSPLCIQVLDENKNLEFVNKSCRESYNLAEDQDLRTWKWVNTVKDSYVDEINKRIEKAYFGETSKMDIKHQKGLSNSEWASMIFTPIKDSDGEVKKIILLSSDITKLKKAESEVENSSKLFRTFIDSLPFCVKWYDSEGKIVSINRYGKDEHFLTGKTDEEIKKLFKSSVVAEHKPLVKEGMELAKKGIQKSYDIQHEPGSAKTDWVHNTFIPIKGEGEEVKYILMISQDVTKEKKIEEERKRNLEKAEETKMALYNILEDAKESEKMIEQEKDRSEAIISSMGECLVVLSRDFKIVLMNKKAGDVLGLTPADAIGQDFRELVLLFNKKNENIIGGDRPLEKLFNGEIKVLNIGLEDDLFYKSTKNGYQFPIIAAATPLSGKSNMAVMVFQDATKMKELDESKNSFISIASHQLRTPLTSIRWYVEMLSSDESGNLTADQKDFLDRVYKNVIKLGETINLLLSMARIESGKTIEQKADVDIAEVVSESVKEQEPGLKQKKLNFEMKVLNDLPKIKADTAMLHQVVGNLLSNAIRYTDINGRIELDLSYAGNEIVCAVKDDGIGVPEKERSKLFQKFYRAPNAISKVPDGSGLGLSLVRSLVGVWKGKVDLESPTTWEEKNGKPTQKGSKFSFTIPVNK